MKPNKNDGKRAAAYNARLAQDVAAYDRAQAEARAGEDFVENLLGFASFNAAMDCYP